MPTVFDSQGVAYSAVQLSSPTTLGAQIVAAGWWIVTDPYGNRSAVRPDAFDQMFTPVQGVYNLGQPGGAASLDAQGLVMQHAETEGQAGGVATLDLTGRLVQTSGLATLTAGGLVAQHSQYEGQAGGVATLDGASHVAQRLAYEAAAGGVATLDASGDLLQTGGLVLASALGAGGGVATLDGSARVVQAGPNPYTAGAANGVAKLDGNSRVAQVTASGVRHKKAWQFSNGALVFTSTTPADLYTASSTSWTGSDTGPFTIASSGGLILGRLTIGGLTNYYTNLAYTLQIASLIDSFGATVLTHIDLSGSLSFPSIVVGMLFGVGAGTHTVHFTVQNAGGAAGSWTAQSMLVEVEEFGG